MKILMVNKFHYLRGGAERYAFELGRLLERRGHQVIPFSTRDPRNLPAPPPAVFVPGTEFDRAPGPGGALRLAARVVYSRTARRAMGRALDSLCPDVVHLHNIAHHFSPSILLELGARRVPVVQTVHDFKLLCPTYLMLRHGVICERCSGGRYYQAVLGRCNRGSLARSAVSAVESYLHAGLRSYDRVGRFHCPSRFLAGKLAAGGIDASRLVHLPLFVEAERFGAGAGPRPGGYALYVGRLSAEKGVQTLIAAARLAPEVEWRLAGEGPERPALEAAVARQGLGNLRLLGRLDGEALHAVWRQAALTVVPSQCYENFPLVVAESMAFGKPVVASRLGGLAELVDDGRTGCLVEAGDAAALAAAVRALAGDGERLRALGAAARAQVEAELTPERHLAGMLRIYQAAGAPAAVAPGASAARGTQ